MKKRVIAVIMCATLSLSALTGCGASSVQKLADTAQRIAEEATATDTPAAPTETPGPVETNLALKKAGTVGDWKVKVNKVAAKSKIKTSKYMEAKADKGNLLVIVNATVTNNGKEKATFLPSVGREDTMVTAKIIYKDGYEYLPSYIAGYDKDLTNKGIDPLAKKSGVIAFNVPKKVAKDLKSCSIRIGTKGEAIVYPAK